MEELENEYVSPRPIAMKWGAIAGVVGILSTVLQDVLNMVQETAFGVVGAAISIALIVMAHREYKSSGDGFMDYGQGVGMGFWYGLVSSAISSVFLFIYVKFISTTFLDSIKEKQYQALEERGMSDAQIEQSMEMTSAFSGPTAMLVMGIIGGVIIAVVLALIVSAFTKKSRPEFE